MSNVELHPEVRPEIRRERIGRRISIGGSAVETLLGLTAVVLSILALAGLVARPLASIAVIAAGAALLFEGAAVAAGTRGRAAPSERRLIMEGVGADSVAGIGAGAAMGGAASVVALAMPVAASHGLERLSPAQS